MSEWKVVALHLNPGKDGPIPVSEIEVVAGKGFKGDKHFGWKTRQSLFISTESLGELGYEPGVLREQVAINMPGLQSLPVGTRLEVGSLLFEIQEDCAPCFSMAKRLGREPENFIAEASFKRGMFAQALSSGKIKMGDAVRVSERA